MVEIMQGNCAANGGDTTTFTRRSAMKIGGFVLGAIAVGPFAGLAQAKAAGGSGLLLSEDYGVGGVFDDFVRFQFVEELEDDVQLRGTNYPATIEYWIGCESVGGPEAARKTFQGYLIEDDTGDNGEGGNQAVMYIYEKRPVSFDWHVFVEDEACGEDYLKVGYEPGEDGASPEEPGNQPPDKGGNGEDDGDPDDGDATSDGDSDGGDGGGKDSDDSKGKDADSGERRGDGQDGSGDAGSGQPGETGGPASILAWLVNLLSL